MNKDRNNNKKFKNKFNLKNLYSNIFVCTKMLILLEMITASSWSILDLMNLSCYYPWQTYKTCAAVYDRKLSIYPLSVFFLSFMVSCSLLSMCQIRKQLKKKKNTGNVYVVLVIQVSL